MDQKEIDELLKTGTFNTFNQKQEELIKNIQEKTHIGSEESNQEIPVSQPPVEVQEKETQETKPQEKDQQGKVMGQLSRVTEEAEAGTNMVMSFMENVLNTVSKQQGFIKDIRNEFKERPDTINVDEVLTFVYDGLYLIEEHIYQAMDAFQFQDIGRQKLMKVMYTLARLNEYLNELLGGESEKRKQFGRKIEDKTLEKDKDKAHADNVVSEFKEKTEDPGSVASNDDVDSIIAAFQKNQKS